MSQGAQQAAVAVLFVAEREHGSPDTLEAWACPGEGGAWRIFKAEEVIW